MASLHDITLVRYKHLVLYMYIAAGLQSKQNVDCKAIIYHKMKEDWQRTEYFRRIG